jgi:hypothetical protein
MCGRDAIHDTWAEIAAFSKPLTLELPATDPLPNYSDAPTQKGISKNSWLFEETFGT